MGKPKKTIAGVRKVTISSQAIQNIHEITGYIAFVGRSPENAIRVGDALFATIERIGKNPLAFKECPELGHPQRLIDKLLGWRHFDWSGSGRRNLLKAPENFLREILANNDALTSGDVSLRST